MPAIGARMSGGRIWTGPSLSIEFAILASRGHSVKVTQVPEKVRMRTGTDPREVAMSTMNTTVRDAAPSSLADGPWIRSRKFDLLFLTASGILVFLPYLSYGLLQRLGASTATASLIVGLAVTLLVGGPHIYSTYLRTALEPRFRERFGWLAYAPLVVIPALVVIGSFYAFLLLLTAFFFWASVHVTHQAQFISETYRRKVGSRITTLDRLLDGAVILGALYTVAMYKFVTGRFTMGSSALLFPEFLKHIWIAQAFTAGFAALFLYYVIRTMGEIRRGEASWPRLLFRHGGRDGHLRRCVPPSLERARHAQDRAYYVVVLSFLLVHYFYDHFLFRDFAPLDGSQFSAVSYQSGAPSPHLQTEN